MERRSITGLYRLEAGAQQFFGTPTLHFRQIEGAILGRFGARGTLKGEMEGHILRAKWKNDTQSGWMVLTFDERFGSLQGDYGVYDETTGQERVMGSLTAKRDVRKRSA